MMDLYVDYFWIYPSCGLYSLMYLHIYEFYKFRIFLAIFLSFFFHFLPPSAFIDTLREGVSSVKGGIGCGVAACQ